MAVDNPDDDDYNPHLEPPPCGTCGRPHYRQGHQTCHAHKRNGMPCMKWPIRGGRVCERHGANEAARAAAGEREDMRRRAEELAMTPAPTPDELRALDPYMDLLYELWASARAVEFWGRLVAELEVPVPGDHTQIRVVENDEGDARPVEVMGDVTAIIGPDRFGELRTHPYVQQWEKERQLHSRIAKWAIDAGLDERMVQLAEDEAAMIERVVRRAIESVAGLTEDQRLGALRVAADELRALPMGPPSDS